MQSKTNYTIMAYKVLDIANKLLLRAKNNERGDLMSNMKLQKMLYYQQGFHLAYFGTPLFDEDIEAWMYGPVVPSVYAHYKNCGRQGIMPETEEELPLDKKEEALFSEVYRVYGAYDAIGLMDMTHSETPWKATPTGQGNIINKELMQSFFKKRLK